jgi:capsular exopolysaccharide synthesis family protein
VETSNQLPADERDPISEIMDALRSFVGVLEKRKWFAVGVLVATVGASLVVTMRQTPIYEASATIQIDRRSPAVLNRSQEVIELGTSDYWSIKEYMQTQVEVLKSRRLARRVVDKLSLGIDEKFYGLDRVKPPLSEEMKRKIIAASDPAAVLVGKLSVEVRDESQIVTVKVLDPDPHMAQDLANAVVSEYQDENLEYKKRVVTDAISELRNMLARLRSEKEDAEARVLEFERRYALGSLENRKGIVRERLRMLHDAYVKAGIARTEAEASQKRIEVAGRIAQVEALLAQKDLSRVAHPVLVADGTVSTLKLRLVELDNTVAEMEARYLPKMPAMKAAYSQRSQVREALQRQCRLLLESDLIRLNGELEESNDALKRAIQIEDDLRASLDLAREEEAALVKLELDYKPLLKKKTELDGYFEEVNRRYTETNLSAQVETNNVRIQDTAALPTAPVKPNRKLNLIVGLVLGLVLGIGCALLVESLDATLKTREDIEAVANIEFFGLIPAIPDIEQPDGEGPHNRPELVAFHNPKSSVAEHFRTAKTNLFFSGSGKRPKVILVTSPGAREGKTTVVSNLATVTAAAGARCILVDADMRRPRVHRLLSLPRRPGTAEYFVSTHPVETFIKASGVPGLDVLTCGSISSNPVEILESPKFRSTLARLAETYDVVFVDTPPVLAVSDAKILCPMVDAAVLVVRAGQTMRDALREARRMLSPVASTSLGVILNCFDIEKHSYRYYYYRSKKYGYYNYHYAYSEGETESEGATGKSRTGSSGSDKGSKWAGP